MEFGHGELVLWQSLGEFNGLFLVVWVEFLEEILHLKSTGVVQQNLHVASSRSQKSWVKLFSVIGGHENDSSLLRSDSVEGIEKSSKGDSSSPPSVLVLVDILTLNKDAIDILKKDDGLLWSVIQSSVEAIVTKGVSTQVQVADVEFQGSSHSLGERSLTGSWRAVEKVASSVWDSLFLVPLRRLLEQGDVVDNLIGKT